VEGAIVGGSLFRRPEPTGESRTSFVTVRMIYGKQFQKNQYPSETVWRMPFNVE
jgi:hypothetical protein